MEREETEMKKTGSKILQGAREALAIAKGEADPSAYRVHVPAEVDTKSIRGRMGLSQNAFAKRYGFTPSQVRDWEQGRFCPTGATRAYIMVIAREPDAVDRALHAA